jgi:phospholipid-translocating ATPase
MGNIVPYTDWLEEECGNMARKGLRTIVVAKKSLDQDMVTYHDFDQRYHAVKMTIQDREWNVQRERC